MIPTVTLRPGGERRAMAGHAWIFANELATPVRELPPGGQRALGAARQAG